MVKRRCENCDTLRICDSDCINASFVEFLADFENNTIATHEKKIIGRKGVTNEKKPIKCLDDDLNNDVPNSDDMLWNRVFNSQGCLARSDMRH